MLSWLWENSSRSVYVLLASIYSYTFKTQVWMKMLHSSYPDAEESCLHLKYSICLMLVGFKDIVIIFLIGCDPNLGIFFISIESITRQCYKKKYKIIKIWFLFSDIGCHRLAKALVSRARKPKHQFQIKALSKLTTTAHAYLTNRWVVETKHCDCG